MDEIKKMTPMQAMQLAIEEGKKGVGFVSPNPPVGCVILDKDFQFLSSGYHKKLGADHAEIDALKKIKDSAQLKGAHVYVTLEPCAHEGRTPSCAKALAQLPIASVTYGLKDPNPLVAGKGLQILKEASIQVECFDGLKKELESLAEVFLLNMRDKKCFIALKVASSIDGKIALSSGESKWITSPKARELSHNLRGVYDATAVGFGTYLKDNPSLNIRHGLYKNKENHKIIIFDKNAESLKTLNESKIVQYNEKKNIFIVIDKKYEAKIKAQEQINFIFIDYNDEINDLHKKLLENQIYSLYIEGGAKVLSNFITHKAFHCLHVFIGAKLLGKGLSWTKELQYASLDEVLELQLSQIEHIDNDIMLKYTI